jgi:hypothetical protein
MLSSLEALGSHLGSAFGQLIILLSADFLKAACPLYDQAEENVQHIIISCLFARQAWALILQRLDLLAFAPQGMNNRFSSWWCCTIKGVLRVEREGLNTLIILVAWETWKHRNACV